MCEHLGISALTGKRLTDDDSAIKEHLLFCNHTPDLEDFSILATNNNDFKVTLTFKVNIYFDRIIFDTEVQVVEAKVHCTKN